MERKDNKFIGDLPMDTMSWDCPKRMNDKLVVVLPAFIHYYRMTHPKHLIIVGLN